MAIELLSDKLHTWSIWYFFLVLDFFPSSWYLTSCRQLFFATLRPLEPGSVQGAPLAFKLSNVTLY